MSRRLPMSRSSRTRRGLALLCLLMLLSACGGESGDQAAVVEPAATEPLPEGSADQDRPAEQGPTQTNPAPSPLEGETIEFVVPYEAGGGYDQYARILAPFLADCVGAEVIVVNEPGAGGLLATNNTAIAPPDGTRIQLLNTPGAIAAQLSQAEGVQFDLTEMSWLGRVAAEPDVVAVGPESEFETFQDLTEAERPVRFAATGPGGTSYLLPTVLAPVYDFELDIVTGFAGSGEMQAAVTRGDTDALTMVLDAAAASFEAGDLRPLVLVGAEDGESGDVPTVADFPPVGETEQQVLDSYVALVQTARSVAAPPGLSEDILASLREGLECAFADDALQAQAEAAGRPLDPLPGDETAELVESVLLNSPEAFRELVRQSFG